MNTTYILLRSPDQLLPLCLMEQQCSLSPYKGQSRSQGFFPPFLLKFSQIMGLISSSQPLGMAI